MNWKQLLIKGLPVFVIAAVIVIIAVIASRPEPQPELSADNAKKLVVDFEGLKVTNQELYDMMKYNNGLYSLLDKVDRTLLTDKYKDEIDTEALEDKIASAKEEDEDKFYENMINLGVITGKDDAEKDAKIKEYYLIEFLQKAYAKEQAIKELDTNNDGKLQDETSVKDKMDELKANPDYCVIPLRFSTKTEAEAKIAEFKSNPTGLQAKFSTIWNEQNPEFENNVDTYFTSFDCDYEQVVYNNESSTYRDFIFTDANYNNHKFNETPKLINNKYYIVLRVAQAPTPTDLNKLEDYVTEQLISDKLTSAYINKIVNQLREDQKLKIYDAEIARQYKKNVDDSFKGSDFKNRTTIATFKNLDGETVTLTTDMLFDDMKKEYAVENLIDLVNYEALSTIDEIQLTKSEINEFKKTIDTYKTQFLASGEAKTRTWSEYLKSMGIFSEKQLINQFSMQDLVTRYVLGYEDKYTGVAPISKEDVNAAAAEWFKYEASHILITFGENSINPDGRDKAVAEKMATQIIEGCSETDITSGTCYIEYEGEPFEGLNNTDASEYEAVFTALAKAYSEDAGSKDNGGDLGFFGPGKMVKPFEDKAKYIVENDLIYSDAPVETKIEGQYETITGYHVIYVTDTVDAPVKPAGYDDIEDPSISADKDVVAYYDHLETIKGDLEKKHTIQAFVDQKLALLRDELNFAILDETIQKHYAAINELQKAYEEE